MLSKNIKVKLYRNINMPAVSYGCGNQPLTLRERHRLRVFENRVLRKVSGAETDQVPGEWRRLHNKKL
jgi:hypothetical protein